MPNITSVSACQPSRVSGSKSGSSSGNPNKTHAHATWRQRKLEAKGPALTRTTNKQISAGFLLPLGESMLANWMHAVPLHTAEVLIDLFLDLLAHAYVQPASLCRGFRPVVAEPWTELCRRTARPRPCRRQAQGLTTDMGRGYGVPQWLTGKGLKSGGC